MRIPLEEMRTVFARAGDSGLLDDEDTSVLFYDLSRVERRFREIEEAFPGGSLHAIAIKANPVTSVLEFLAKRGSGFEVASMTELQHALHAGVPPRRVVYDSPAKTRRELEHALKIGAYLNADNPTELERISDILQGRSPASPIGVRVNPQVGQGAIASTSVASAYSKFGIPLGGSRGQLVELFERHDWLCGLHAHIGSQGFRVEDLAAGVRRVVDLADEIDAALSPLGRRVTHLDVGGGLSVPYREGRFHGSVAEYGKALRSSVPELFSGRFTVVTEFGRYVHANAGWAASRVEYVKATQPETIVTHLGADMFLRRVYNPQDWHHEISIVGPGGQERSGDRKAYAVAGPLCFGADFLSRSVELPAVSEGDFVLVHDAGAYTFSMWSRYNSRRSPKVIGYEGATGALSVLRARESSDDVLAFWGRGRV